MITSVMDLRFKDDNMDIAKWTKNLFKNLFGGKRVFTRKLDSPRLDKQRNLKCHCGSGKKYKKCHWLGDTAKINARNF